MSGVFARSCSHCSAKVVLRRKKRKEEGDAGEARRDPQALLPTETVVVTPGAVQLETRSPFSDVTGRCIRQGHPSLPCVAPSRSHLRPSSPLSFLPLDLPRPPVVPLALRRVIVLISWSRYQVSLPRIWLPAYTALPVYVFVLYGVGNKDSGETMMGFGIKIHLCTSPLELLSFFVLCLVLRLRFAFSFCFHLNLI